MLVLYESSLGYCLFKLSDANLLSKTPSEQRKSFEDPSNLIKLQSVHRFSGEFDPALAVVRLC